MNRSDDEEITRTVSNAEGQAITEDVLERYAQELKDFSNAVRSQFQDLAQLEHLRATSPKDSSIWETLERGIDQLLVNRLLESQHDQLGEQEYSDHENT